MVDVDTRRVLRRIGLALVVAAGAAVVTSDVSVQWQLHASRARLAQTRTAVSRTEAALAAAQAAARRDEAESKTVEAETQAVGTEVASAQRLLSQARSGVDADAVVVTDVRTCAAGVSRSVAALKAGNRRGAAAALGSVTGACESMVAGEPGGPVYPFDFADPAVLGVKGTYYAYGTNSTDGNIQVLTSSDLTRWREAGDAVPRLPAWATAGDTWAPAVVHVKRSYLLYYTVAEAGTKTPCLSVATARRPAGPFTDTSAGPLECQSSLGGSIDPFAYTDPSGQLHLVWKSNGAGSSPATIWTEPLDAAGTALSGRGPTALLRPDEPWEAGVVEAPSMAVVDGSYYLFYSGNDWNSSAYAEGVARCSGPDGPCRRLSSGPLLASGPLMVGPGGASVFTDPAGHLDLAFGAWLPGAVGYPHPRLLFIRSVSVMGATVTLAATG